MVRKRMEMHSGRPLLAVFKVNHTLKYTVQDPGTSKFGALWILEAYRATEGTDKLKFHNQPILDSILSPVMSHWETHLLGITIDFTCIVAPEYISISDGALSKDSASESEAGWGVEDFTTTGALEEISTSTAGEDTGP